jgi:hypothetical protein
MTEILKSVFFYLKENWEKLRECTKLHTKVIFKKPQKKKQVIVQKD